jgi:two-component system NarL family sensor kinase
MTAAAAPGRTTAVVLGSLGALLVGVLLAVAAAGVSRGHTFEPYVLTNLVVGAGYLAPAAVIAWHRPRSWLVLLLAVGGVGHLLSGVGLAGVRPALDAGLPGLSDGLGALAGVGWLFGLGPLFQLLLVLYPDGRLPSRRWRWFPWAAVGLLVVSVAAQLLDPDGVLATGGLAPVDLALTAVAVGALVGRYRRGDEAVRGQVLWLLLAVLVLVAVNLERAVSGTGPEFGLLAFACVPAAMAIGIVRHNLLDIRVVLARTVLYGALVAVLLAVYAAVAAATTWLFPVDRAGWGPVAAVLVVAFALGPLRDLLRRGVTRAFYGRRADPTVAAELVGRRLGDAAGLGGVLEQARSTLRLPGLEVRDPAGRVLAAAPADEASGPPLIRTGYAEVPLTSRGEQLGTLGGDSADRGVLPAPRRQCGALGARRPDRAAAAGVRARRGAARVPGGGWCRRGRASGRCCTAISTTGSAPPSPTPRSAPTPAANLVHRDPDAAVALLADVRAGVRGALDEVRRVVYGLRPLALEERGLLGAVRERAASAHPLPTTVDTPGPLPELTPAVELAAYRIVSEGIANAQRHSRGRRVRVRLEHRAHVLVVAVEDDGGAPDGYRPGVGLRSVVERAEELGGSAEVVAEDTRWVLAARLPLG